MKVIAHLTVRQACHRLGCSRWTLDRLFKAGKLTKITQRRSVYVDADELNAYIRRNGTVGNAQAANQALSAEDLAALKALAEIGKQFVDAQRVA